MQIRRKQLLTDLIEKSITLITMYEKYTFAFLSIRSEKIDFSSVVNFLRIISFASVISQTFGTKNVRSIEASDCSLPTQKKQQLLLLQENDTLHQHQQQEIVKAFNIALDLVLP